MFPEDVGIRLSITRPDAYDAPIPINSLYITFLRIGNLGRDPIRDTDIVHDDPLQLCIENGKVLDVSSVQTTRETTHFVLKRNDLDTDDRSTANVTFSFLDYQDGALVCVLTERPEPRISLPGTVIGMPSGALSKNSYDAAQTSGCLQVFLVPVSLMALAITYVGLKELLHIHPSEVVEARTVAAIVIVVMVAFSVFSDKTVMKQYHGDWPLSLSIPYWFLQSWQSKDEEKRRLERQRQSLGKRNV